MVSKVGRSVQLNDLCIIKIGLYATGADSSFILQGLLWTRALTLQQTVLLPNHQDTLTCGFPRVRYVLQSSPHSVVKFCFRRLFSEQKISCIAYTNLIWSATLPSSLMYSRYPSCGRSILPFSRRCETTSHIADGYDELEGCPVLRLHDVAEDVENLLTALYDGP